MDFFETSEKKKGVIRPSFETLFKVSVPSFLQIEVPCYSLRKIALVSWKFLRVFHWNARQMTGTSYACAFWMKWCRISIVVVTKTRRKKSSHVPSTWDEGLFKSLYQMGPFWSLGKWTICFTLYIDLTKPKSGAPGIYIRSKNVSIHKNTAILPVS